MNMNPGLAVWYCWVGGCVIACVGGMFILGPEGASNIPKNSSREKAGKILVAIGVLIIAIGAIKVI
ncbi:MAG: hypothetical protein WC499_00685 [Patescibacteria group bacterium]